MDVCGGGVLGVSKSSRVDLCSREINTTYDWGLTEEDGGNPGVIVVDVPVGNELSTKTFCDVLSGQCLMKMKALSLHAVETDWQCHTNET